MPGNRPGTHLRGLGKDRRAGAVLYSFAMILALLGLAVALALRQWTHAVPFVILLADLLVPTRSQRVSILLGMVAVASGAALGAWLVMPVAATYFVSHLRASLAIRRASFPKAADVGLARLGAVIQSTFPSGLLDLPRVQGGALTSRALLDAAMAADPGRWAGVTVTEPRNLSAEGGEVVGTGWTVVAGEAALIAMNLPNASLPLSVHDLAIAATLLPGSNAQRALSDKDRATTLSKVAAMPVVTLVRAMSTASRSSGGELILRRTELVKARRAFATALTVGDWRESPNPQLTPAPKAAAPARPKAGAPASAARKPAVPASMPKPKPKPRPSARRQTGFRAAYLRPSLRAWRPAARILWWGLRPLCTAAGTVACALAPWHVGVGRGLGLAVGLHSGLASGDGVSPWAAAVAALAVLVIRPVRHLWASVLLAAALVWVSPAAAAAVLARGAVTLAALLLNGPGWRSGLAKLTRSRQEILGVPDIDGARAALADGLTKPGDLGIVEGLLGLAGATWATADVTQYLRQGWMAVRGVFTGHWPLLGRVPAAETLVIQMAFAETVISRFLQVLATIAAGSLALLVFHADTFHVLGHEVSKLVAGVIAVVVTWPRAELRGRTNQVFREHKNFPSAIVTWAEAAIWLAIVSVAGYFTIGTAAVWTVASGTVIGTAAAVAATRATRPALAPHQVIPQLPAALRWHKGYDVWQAARTALAAGDTRTAERIWRQLADGRAAESTGGRIGASGGVGAGRTVAGRPVSAAAKAMMASLALDRGDWQEAVEWADLACRSVPVSAPVGYLTRTLTARVMLGAGLPERAAELFAEVEAAGHARRVRQDRAARVVLAQALVTSRGDQAARAENAAKASEVLSHAWAGFQGAAFGPLVETEAIVAAMSEPTEQSASRLRAVLTWVDDVNLSDSVADRKRLDTAAARAWLALGDVELRLGKAADAEPSLRRALNSFDPAAELMNHATARVLLGCATWGRGQEEGAIRDIEGGLAGLEEARGQLRSPAMRSQLVVRLDDVYSRALDALITMLPREPRAGEAGALLLESLRRDALAALLRGGKALRLDPETRAIQRQISELEAAGTPSQEQEKAREALRDRLGVKMSALYADAYAPVTVTMDDLRRRAGGADVLAFKITRQDGDCLRAYSTWIPADGDPLVRSLTVTGPRALEVIGLRVPEPPADGGEPRVAGLEAKQARGGEVRQLWMDLAADLLPGPLAASLARRDKDDPLSLYVVPDGVLAAFPWAGLRLADGRPLVEVARIQVTPAMGVLPEHSLLPRWSGAESARGPASEEILLHCDVEKELRDLAMLSAISDVRLARDRAEIEALLHGGSLAGAYFSAHGSGDGLDQAIRLKEDGGPVSVSASVALTLPWPSWLVFASCIVGTVRIMLGSEPTGLVTSCLLGGAEAVVAGVVEVDANVANTLCVQVVRRILCGEHPADALRHAQLAFLDGRPLAPANRWAGFICISKVPVPQATMRASM